MRHRSHRQSRSGVATLELILVVPVLMILLIFAVQFGIASIYHAAVTHSATVAAREAGKGADFDAVLASIQQVLGIHGIDLELANTTVEPDDIKVIQEWCCRMEEDGTTPAYPPKEYGTLACSPPTGLPLGFNEVRITVCVDLAATKFRGGLTNYGLGFPGRVLKATSLVVKELEQDVCGIGECPFDDDGG